jgi:DNA-binding CsgD family transcriptional regulator/tetratricopeptide (TPR) repeat protein
MARPVGFVGREGELSRLERALSDDARLVLVVADAGIGKTRFAEEGMRRAAAAGMLCVLGGCLPLAGELPLLPVADALGQLSRLADGELLEVALGRVPRYVRAEVARLLPWLETAEPDRADRTGGWQRDRLFSAVAELLDAAAGKSGLVAVIEDVHWADSATLDCLTYLARAGGSGALTVVVTCRSDEVTPDGQVADWLAHARGAGEVEEIRLGPLSRAETAQQIAILVGEEPPGGFADDLYARAEGNPFFTEQLAAAALAGPVGDALLPPAGLPERLADLLLTRVSHVGDDARAALTALAVAGRALTEDMLAAIAGLGVDEVRGALQELASARLLATSEGYRPRHALLAEAVAGGLLPGERTALHERTALVFESTGDGTLAAEVAGHWAAAGRADKELPARMAAAAAAEYVFGYAEAAAHWQRAIELCQAVPEASQAGIDLPRLYLRAIRALENSGDSGKAGELAQEAYHRFASHPDPATAAVIYQWAGFFRGMRTPAAGLPLIKEALRLFEQAPPSADQAEAWLTYGNVFLLHAEGRQEAGLGALNRALEIAEAAGATGLIPQILATVAVQTFLRGQIEEGFALLRRGRALAEASGNSEGILWLANNESYCLLLTGEFEKASEAALAGLQTARNTGRQTSNDAAVLANSACDGLLALGQTASAAALIDPLITRPPDLDNWPVHLSRAEIDLLRGDIAAADERLQQINALISHFFSIDSAREVRQRAADLARWAGRPTDALDEVRSALALFEAPDLTIFCGRLLAAGMAACADLAERAHARRDGHRVSVAMDAASELVSWVDRMAGAPFTDHPFVAVIPAERATWNAERTRLGVASDPAAWRAAAKTWQDMGCPHRAGYAWWRHAEAQLNAGQPPAAAAAPLRAAVTAAEGHAPLLTQIRKLAERARIPLQAPSAASPVPGPAEAPAPYGLTGRELAVLRLLAAGRTNAQIGAELYISPKTAGVHVTSILRKFAVTNRVQAAALAERAGLLHIQQP